MAIWVGKQKMACKACIKGHRSSQCNHIGGPLWAVRPAGRPNKACIHGPGDLCLCAHYFPLTFLKAAVPRSKKCPCSASVPGKANGKAKCSCGAGKTNDAGASTPEDDTQPIFYQDLVARGLQVTTEPVDLGVPASVPASCCSVPASASAPAPAPAPVTASCCSAPTLSLAIQQIATTVPTPTLGSCCSAPVKIEPGTIAPTATNGHHSRSESMSSAPFTPIQQIPSPPDFSSLKFDSPMVNGNGNGNGAGAHICDCGPACNCVLCIDHPYNTATMNHIATEFGPMMSHDAPFSPTNGTQSGLFPQGWLANGGAMPPFFNDPAFFERYKMISQQYMQQPQQPDPPSYSPPSQANDMDIILNPADFDMINFAFPPMDDSAEHSTENDGIIDGMGLGQLPEFDLNGFCGGVPDGCPCGDDCACIGCQVHKPTTGTGLGLQQQHWP